MRKLLSFVLAAVMLLSLCACSSKEDQAFEAACALLEEGKYEEALEAFADIESYARVAEKVEEAQNALEKQLREEEEARQRESVSFLYGTWKEISCGITVTFFEDGLCHWKQTRYPGDYNADMEYSAGYFLLEDKLYSSGVGSIDRDYQDGDYGFPITTEERNGVTHMFIGQYDFVKEADYALYEPELIQITMDNWQDYFELKTGTRWIKNAFGEVDAFQNYTCLCLKEEYAHRLRTDLTNVAIGYTSQAEERTYTADYTVQELHLGGVTWRSNEIEHHTFTVFDENVYYQYINNNFSYEEYGNEPPVLPYILYTLSVRSPWDGTRLFLDNCQINRISGTLALMPE